MIPEIIEKNTFLCFNNLAGCKNSLQIRMRIEYEDGAVREYTGIEMLRGDEKAPNASYYEKNGELWISSRPKGKTPDNGIKKITLSLKNPSGEVERLCIGIGTAAFDPASRSFVPVWERLPLRHEIITMVPETEGVRLEFSMGGAAEKPRESLKAAQPPRDSAVHIQKPQNSPQESAESADTVADTVHKVHTANDTAVINGGERAGTIAADMRILSFYSGDTKERAYSLLEQARTSDTKTAEELISQAEGLIAECVRRATDSVNEYRKYMI